MLTPRQKIALDSIPADRIFVMEPFNPEAVRVRDELMDEIQALLPNAELLTLGSLELGIGGQNDLDIVVIDEAREASTSILTAAYGAPLYSEPNSVKWKFMRKGFIADFSLRTEKPDHFFEILSSLKEDPALLNEYLALKQAADGLSFRTYLERKFHFYNRILDLKNALVPLQPTVQ